MRTWPEIAAEWAYDQMIANLVSIRLRRIAPDHAYPLDVDIKFARQIDANKERLHGRYRQILKVAVQDAFCRAYKPLHSSRLEQLAECNLSAFLSDQAREFYATQSWARVLEVHLLVEKPWADPAIFTGIRRSGQVAMIYLNEQPTAAGAPAWGPAATDSGYQLALWMCMRRLNDSEAAQGVAREFAEEVLATIDDDHWAMSGDEVGAHIERIAGNVPAGKPIERSLDHDSHE